MALIFISAERGESAYPFRGKLSTGHASFAHRTEMSNDGKRCHTQAARASGYTSHGGGSPNMDLSCSYLSADAGGACRPNAAGTSACPLRYGHPDRWPLPPNRGPWQLKWDDSRNLIWFAEGTHSDPPLDQIGALDPETSVLREWGIPTAGGYVHGTAIDRSFNIWFTEVRLNRIGRLQPDSNTITEWTLDPTGFPHGIAVDDIISDSVRVWFSERDTSKISSLDLATGIYIRHTHPLGSAWPHSVIVAPDHSVWFVETCGNRVGQLVSSGGTDTWKFWQPPTQGGICSPPNGIGPLFGNFVNGEFWYSEPFNGRVIRLRPAENSFSIWNVPGAANGSKMITQPAGDPDGNIFFPEMNGDRIGRLEPVGPTTPTVVVVVPTVVTQHVPVAATSLPVSVVYTPIVTQLTPVPRTLTGTRTGSIVEWALPTIPAGGQENWAAGRGWRWGLLGVRANSWQGGAICSLHHYTGAKRHRYFYRHFYANRNRHKHFHSDAHNYAEQHTHQQRAHSHPYYHSYWHIHTANLHACTTL